MNHKAIVSDLRARLVRGEWQSQRLPTQVELIRQYDSSKVTIQRAITQLKDEGFIETFGKRGTFSKADSPHLKVIGVVITQPDTLYSERNHVNDILWDQIISNKELLETRLDRKIIFYHINFHKPEAEQQRLLDDAEKFCLNGIIIIHLPDFNLLKQLNNLDIPVIVLSRDERIVNTMRIFHDYNSLISKSMEYFQESGNMNIGLLSSAMLPCDDILFFKEAAEEHGLKTCDRWIHGIGLNEYSMFFLPNLLKLLLETPKNQRPDGLLVLDQNLLEYVIREIQNLNLTIGKDIRIISQSIFPTSPFPLSNGIKRIGFDLRQTFMSALAYIDKWKQCRRPGKCLSIPASFEEETEP